MKLQKGQVAVVTGGALGIGKGMVLALAQKEVSVVSIDIIDAENLNTIAEAGKYANNCMALTCDCSNMDQINEAVDKIMGVYGRIDILINNVGGFVETRFIEDSFYDGLDKFDEMITINTKSTYAFTLKIAPIMKQQGSGGIINVLTNHLHRDICPVSSYEHAYDCAKYAQMSLNMSMAEELKEYGIRVNAIDPAATATEMLEVFFNKLGMELNLDNIEKVTGTRSLLYPEDTALAAIYLLEWEDPQPVGKNYLLRYREDCEALQHVLI